MLGRAIDIGNPVADHPLNRGVAGWWLPLPNNSGASRLHDLTTNRNHGTLTNGPTWATGPNGFAALSFDGTDDKVTFAPVDVSSGVTFSLWVNLAVVGDLNRRSFAHSKKVYFSYDGNVLLEWWPNTDTTRVTASWSPTAGRWYHVTGTQSGTSYAMYVDGAPLQSGTTVSLNNNAEGNSFGVFSSGTTWPMSGRQSDQRIYTRALSGDAEAWVLYDQSRRGHPDLLRRAKPRSFAASVGGTAYTLTAATGSYTLTGGSAGLSKGFTLAAGGGSYTLTGGAASLLKGSVLSASAGDYTLTGGSASLLKGRTVAASAGSYTVTGGSATLAKGSALSASAGSYTLTGGGATLAKGRTLTAGAGSYTIDGGAATLVRTYVVSAGAGSYTVTGGDATLTYSGVTSQRTFQVTGDASRTFSVAGHAARTFAVNGDGV